MAVRLDEIYGDGQNDDTGVGTLGMSSTFSIYGLATWLCAWRDANDWQHTACRSAATWLAR
jgi:hypothetical protein